MANNDANMSDGEQTSPSRARNRPRGRERERRRRRSRFRSRSRSRGRRGYLRSPERRDSSHCSPPRDRSPAPRNVPLVIERTTSCEHLVIPTIQSYRNSTGHHRKIRSYHDEGDEVVLVPSAPMPKPKQRCKREIFDEYEHVSHQNKRQRPLEMPKVDKPKHQPVLSFDGQSTEGFMDFEDVLSSLLQPTTFKPRKSVFFAAQETPQGMSTDQATHPDSMRGFSDGADMNADNNDTLTSDSIEAPRGHRPAPESSNAILIPVGDCRWRARPAGPPTPCIPASSAQDNDGWGADDWGGPANSAPESQLPVTVSYSSAQYDDIFAEPLDGASMLPPPLSTVPSYNRLPSPANPRPVSSVVSADPRPLRSRQQIYDENLLECDQIEKEDAEQSIGSAREP